MVTPVHEPVITITSSGVEVVPLALVGAKNRTSSGTITSEVGEKLSQLRRRSSTEMVDVDIDEGLRALEGAQSFCSRAHSSPLCSPLGTP